MSSENIVLTTMCVIWDRVHNNVLMVDRNDPNWGGYAPPGGHVEFPESLVSCAIREVKEETGLTVWDLVFKGVAHFVNTESGHRFLVFSYLTEHFSGELCQPTREGRPVWVRLSELDSAPLARGIAERMPLFFREEASEMHIIHAGGEPRDVRTYLV